MLGLRRGKGLALLAALALVVAGCASNERPDPNAWQPGWQRLVDVVPDRSELGEPPSEELCQQTLADIRSNSEGLVPSPTAAIDDLVGRWLSTAEEAFFDCPPEGQDIDSFDDAYDEMRRLEESVDTALAETG